MNINLPHFAIPGVPAVELGLLVLFLLLVLVLAPFRRWLHEFALGFRGFFDALVFKGADPILVDKHIAGRWLGIKQRAEAKFSGWERQWLRRERNLSIAYRGAVEDQKHAEGALAQLAQRQERSGEG